MTTPPVPKLRTKFNIPLDESSEELEEVERKTAPPRPPPPKIRESSLIENPLYICLSEIHLKDDALVVSPSKRTVPPPPPPPPVQWKSSPPPSMPPPPLPMSADKVLPPTPSISLSSSSSEFLNSTTEDSFSANVESQSEQVADGHFVCFNSNVVVQTDKKKIKCYARLRSKTLAFYADDEGDEAALLGPFNLDNVIFLTYIGHNFSLSLATGKEEGCTTVRFTAEDHFAHWVLMLGESILMEPNNAEGQFHNWSCIGKAWTRKGVGCEWKKSFLVLSDTSLYIIDSRNESSVTDLRMVHSLKSKVEKSEWCPKAKRKGQEGPIILYMDALSIALEADNAQCTKDWKEALESVLRQPQTSLETCRLCTNGVPVAVEKCITFVASRGMALEGIYRKSGNKAKEKVLLKQLVQDPIAVHLSAENEEFVFAVADVLRQFLRGLSSPLIPEDRQHELFALVRKGMSAIEDGSLETFLCSLPHTNYCTLRRIASHLTEVAAMADKNRASVQNLAKVFGPTFFCVDSSNVMEKQCEMSEQMSAVVVLVSFFPRVFRETAREAACKEVILNVAHYSKQKKSRAEGMLVSVYLWSKDHRAFNVDVHLAADEVLTQAFSLRDVEVAAGAEYAVVEAVFDGALRRRLSSDERLSSVVVDRWIGWGVASTAHLVVERVPSTQNVSSVLSGSANGVSVSLEGSRKWESCEMRLDGDTLVLSHKNKPLKECAISQYLVYEGCIRKGAKGHSLTLIPLTHSSALDKHSGLCLSFKEESFLQSFYLHIVEKRKEQEANILVHI